MWTEIVHLVVDIFNVRVGLTYFSIYNMRDVDGLSHYHFISTLHSTSCSAEIGTTTRRATFGRFEFCNVGYVICLDMGTLVPQRYRIVENLGGHHLFNDSSSNTVDLVHHDSLQNTVVLY